jgi:hypothetical protein
MTTRSRALAEIQTDDVVYGVSLKAASNTKRRPVEDSAGWRKDFGADRVG